MSDELQVKTLTEGAELTVGDQIHHNRLFVFALVIVITDVLAAKRVVEVGHGVLILL